MKNSYLLEKLQFLEAIAESPNIKNGIWNSFELFINTSDDILKKCELDDHIGCIYMSKEIHNLLLGIRYNFTKTTGISDLGDSYTKAKSNIGKSHFLKAKISKFLKSYRGKFLKM